jgi:hypothetical protein
MDMRLYVYIYIYMYLNMIIQYFDIFAYGFLYCVCICEEINKSVKNVNINMPTASILEVGGRGGSFEITSTRQILYSALS